MDQPIIEAACAWRDWLLEPAGRYAAQWEQARFDAAVADAFGAFALQCGLATLPCLRESRMQCRVLVCDPAGAVASGPPSDAPSGRDVDAIIRIGHFEDLPIASQSVDLVALPHLLEFTDSPHQVLREVERILRPDGRLLISGFNPVSLWGARQAVSGRSLARFMPPERRFVSTPRLHDWLGLLGFQTDATHYGCYRPPFRSALWLQRFRWIEQAGDRWWPICGALYFVSAVKRVRGMRMVGFSHRRAPRSAAPVPVASSRTGCMSGRRHD